MKINNLAELKKLPVGTKVVLISAKIRVFVENKEPEWVEHPHRALNMPRVIEKMQTNAIKFSPAPGTERGSWLYFPPAKFIHPTETGFKVEPQNEWDAELTYDVMSDA